METEPRQTIRETIRLGWKPFLAKVALLGTITWGANEYMYPDAATEMTHEDAAPFEGDELTIMTVNVHDWEEDDSVVYGSLINNRGVLEGLKRAINQYDPDLVCAQEVAKGDELEELHEDGFNIIHATTARYPFIKETGNAVLSKSPIRLVEVEKLPSNKTFTPRNAIVFELDLEDNRVLMMSATHFGTNQEERFEQAEEMMNEFGHLLQGTCGDFNGDDQEIEKGAVAPLQTASNHSFNDPTFPADSPRKEIDHIMLACGRSLPDEKETFSFGSDHRGVVETFDISNC